MNILPEDTPPVYPEGFSPTVETAYNKMSPEAKLAVIEWMQNANDLIDSKGKHAGHTLEQIGRCIHCSCGQRVHGRLPKKKQP